MNQSEKILLAWLVSFGGTFFLLFFFSQNIAPTLNTAFPQFIFPNPSGSVYYSTLYSVPVGLIGIIPILLISHGATEE
jgi:hypothetical protein